MQQAVTRFEQTYPKNVCPNKTEAEEFAKNCTVIEFKTLAYQAALICFNPEHAVAIAENFARYITNQRLRASTTQGIYAHLARKELFNALIARHAKHHIDKIFPY